MKTVAQQVRARIKELFVRRGHEPRWEGSVVKYAVKYLGRHVWRVGNEMDLDDLLQDAYILFMELRERYTVENPQHFMALWKVSLHNWIVNLAKARSRRREQPLGVLDVAEQCGTEEWTEWEWHRRERPVAVGRLVRAVEGRTRRPRMRRRAANRETTNEYLCRMADVPRSVPLRKLFETWLGVGE